LVSYRNALFSWPRAVVWCMPVLMALGGCAPPPEPTVGGRPGLVTRVVSGRVSLGEVVGPSLSANSACGTGNVDASGGFELAVSAEGVQLVTIRDGDGSVRALSLSVPPPEEGEPSHAPTAALELEADAASTATALVFITPGVAAASPAEGAVRVAEISTLAGYSGLRGLVAAALLAGDDVAQAADNEGVRAALGDCIDEWAQAHPASLAAPSGLTVPGVRIAGIDCEVADSAALDRVEVRLSNWGWRFVDAYRRELRDGLETKSPVSLRSTSDQPGVPFMGGAAPASVGSLLFFRAGLPSTQTDTINARSGCTQVEYWIQGPGGLPSSDTLPESISGTADDLDQCMLWTFVAYAFVPVVEVALGVGEMAADASEEAELAVKLGELLWDEVQASTNGLDLLQGLTKRVGEGDAGATRTSAVDFLVALVALAVDANIPSQMGWVAEGTEALAAGAMAVTGLIAGEVNLGLAVEAWLLVPQVARLEVSTTGDLTVGVH